MNIEDFRDYCIAKAGVTEELPFGPDTLVFKVMGKMFALTSLDIEEFRVSVKCDPDLAITLREQFDYIVAAYHMNKKHWNTIYMNSSISEANFKKYIDHSYDLVANSLPTKIKAELKLLS